MKRVLLLTALTLSFSGLAVAQQTAPPADASAQAPAHASKHRAPNPKKELMKMTSELNLTPDQSAKVGPILTDRDAKLAAIKSDSSLTTDDSERKMKEVRKDANNQLKLILTPEQAMQLKQAGKGKKHESQESPSPDAPPAPPAN